MRLFIFVVVEARGGERERSLTVAAGTVQTNTLCGTLTALYYSRNTYNAYLYIRAFVELYIFTYISHAGSLSLTQPDAAVLNGVGG